MTTVCHSVKACVVVRLTSLAQVNFVSVVSKIQVQPSGDFIGTKASQNVITT